MSQIGVPKLVQPDDGQPYLKVVGAWTLASATEAERAAQTLLKPRFVKQFQSVILDLGEIGKVDTSGAWLLCNMRQELKLRGVELKLEGLNERTRLLLNAVEEANKSSNPPRIKQNILLHYIDDYILQPLAQVGQDAMLLLNFLGATFRSMIGIILTPSRFRWFAFVHHLEYVGLRAVPIISLICFLIGAVIMQQSVVQLQKFGAESFSLKMMGVLALREVGVLLTAIMVAGRSGSAFTAEIGAMKMREEVDAMKTLGISPLETLVIPRLIALLVMLPVLTFIGDVMCLLGGSFMAWTYLGMSQGVYWDQVIQQININHFYAGLIKAPFAALAIALVGSLEGLKVSGSAESLGNHVTNSVVKAIFLVIIIDAIFAIFFVAIGF